MIIWLIGMSGAGKTTVGLALTRVLKERYPNLLFLDGDILRGVWGDKLGHDQEGRKQNSLRISRMCAMLDAQNIHVVAAVLSIFPEHREENRIEFSQYFEVFLDAPMSLLEERDTKGIYSKAKIGEIKDVVGLDIEFPRPANADLIISAPEILSPPGNIVERILNAMPKFME